MYRDRAQWTKIRRRILVDKIPIRQMVRETGISRKTIRKMLTCRLPPPYGPRASATREPASVVTTAGVSETPCIARHSKKRSDDQRVAFEWMRSVLQGLLPRSELRGQVGELPCVVTPYRGYRQARDLGEQSTLKQGCHER